MKNTSPGLQMNMQIRGGCFCLFVSVALVLLELSSAQGNHEWSGFVNTLQSSFDYQCPGGLAITGLASIFDDAVNDRRWEFSCGSGGNVANVSSLCTLQSPIHEIRNDINYECPGNSYMSGFSATYSSSDEDRLWSPYCCSRNYSTLINCHTLTSNWENILEGNLNWTTTSDRVVTGMTSFFSAFNRDRRWRFKQCKIQVSCGDPGTPENAVREGDSFLYTDTVQFTCNNGYYLYSGDSERTCQDTGLWSGVQPTCTLCTNIENCADIRCTTDSDQYCFECESNYGAALGESAYRNLNTSCEAYCSWLGGFCYPGDCPIGPSSCNCSAGFSGPDCLNIDTRPELQSCTFSVSSLSSPVACSVNHTNVSYINTDPTSVTGNWEALFNGPSPPPVRPAYVDGYAVGISQTMIIVSVYRHDSYPTDAASMTEHECITADVSQDNPLSSLVTCTGSATSTQLLNHTFLHGDWIKLEAFISNGGYLNITNLDNNDTVTHYYTGSPISPYSLLLLDTQPPVHCSVVPSRTCLTDQGSPLRESLIHDDLSVLWGGWGDDPAGVQKYEIEIYKLVYDSGSALLDKAASSSFTEDIVHDGSNSYRREYSLPDQGPYSIVLIITDKSGNDQYSRRIIVYDADSELLEDSAFPLVAVGGFPETRGPAGSGYWHNSTAVPITVSGVGHFYNTNLKTSNWLAPVANHTPPIPPVYDDTDTAGVPNALGITSLAYTYFTDKIGGASPGAVAQPATFLNPTDDLSLSAVDISVPDLEDGISVSIWFEARDFKENPPAHEKVLVHVDSSPPVLGGLGLMREGVDELLVLYGSQALEDLVILFNARDEHSGLYEIEWSIISNGVMVARGDIPITNYEREICLVDSDCVCDSVGHCHKASYSFSPPSSSFLSSPIAKHDTDYLIIVTVTNHAQLSTTLTRQFTVDLTPPLTGSVFETTTSYNLLDVDYTSSLTFNVNWNGFFDRETDILLYQYIVSSGCSSQNSFQYPGTGMSLLNTNSTSVLWTASTTGIYYTTVVAYNKAYLPSRPVCSDGIVIDQAGPRFEGVVIPGGVVREGLVQLDSGEVWFVDSNRQRSLVEGYDTACINNSALINNDQLITIPIKYNKSLPFLVSPSLCFLSIPFQDIIYTPLDTALNISWIVTDDNGFYDYQIGVSNNNSGLPDILPMVSTGRHAHFTVQGETFMSGVSFYVALEAVDLSGHMSSVLVGPVIIDTSPPIINDSISLVPPSFDNEFYLIYWDEDGFYDDEDLFTLDRYEYSIGRFPYGADVLPFTPLPPLSPSCPLTTHCITIPLQTLLPGNQYHVTLKVSNTGNLATYVPVDPFIVPWPLQDCLSVYEHVTTDSIPLFSLPQSIDIDIIFTEDPSLTVSWRGLQATHLNAQFFVAIGTRPGLTDVVGLTSVPLGRDSYTFSGLLLETGSSYYSLLVANNSISSVNQTSDGFLYLPLIADNQLAFIWDGWSDQYDEDYQLSRTVVTCHWYYPDAVTSHLSHYEWALFRVLGRDSSNMLLVSDYINTGPNEYGMRLSELEPNVMYVTAVRACFKSGCLEPRFSDGFYVAKPPATPTMASLVAEYANGVINVEWSSFSDPELVYYEWSIEGERGGEKGLVRDWERIAANVTRISLSLPLETSPSHQWSYSVILRAFNRAGLSSSVHSLINIIEGASPSDYTVYDVSTNIAIPTIAIPTTQDWTNQDFRVTTFYDIDHTSSGHTLAAVWPQLRFKSYQYSISETRSFMSCQEPYPIACNETINNGASVSGLDLIHGRVYYFCVRGLAEDAYSPSPSGPRTVTVCSNGVIVDLAPPTGGCVQIVPVYSTDELPELRSEERVPVSSGSGQEEGRFGGVGGVDSSRVHSCSDQYGSQSSTSELRLVWDWFQDIEQYRNEPFVYGISDYEYSIGTSPGHQDIVKYTSVGVVRELIVSGLSLTPGLTYYATIRATDQAGHKTIVTSQGITIDSTPPSFGRVWLTPDTIPLTTTQGLRPNWDLIIDTESNIGSIHWSLGSASGRSDVLPWTSTNSTVSLSSFINVTLVDGQPLVLNVLAINDAGLSLIRSSGLVYYDSTPPCISRVFDGQRPTDSEFLDLDYTSNHTHLSAHWNSFSDPHTSLTSYEWSIGTCKGCSDVIPFGNVGLVTESIGKYSYRHDGLYYVSVRGCSHYSGCTLAHSDGILIDVIPPITPLLHHGLTGSSLQIQPSRHTLIVNWNIALGFQSKLSHCSYYVGTSPNDSTYLLPTEAPASVNSLIITSPFLSSHLLPVNRTVYVTLVVTSRSGLTSISHSPGVFISNVPPTLIGTPAINVEWAGSLVGGSQYTSSVLRFDWNFTDIYTSVTQYFFTLYSDEGTYQLINESHAYNIHYATMANLNLKDGDRLRGVVRGCNQAGLCQTGFTNRFVLVDSSPPVDGYFAVGTSSSASLPWSIEEGMSWTNHDHYSFLNLTFTGFSDPHSGVSEYWATVGSGYGMSDLFNPSSPLTVQEHPTENLVYTTTLQLSRTLSLSERLYVWMWCVNGVGRQSHVVTGTFKVGGNSSDGNLELLRSQSCPVVSCEGHCTCSERGHHCDRPVNASCYEMDSSTLSPDMSVISLTLSSQLATSVPPLFTTVTDKLSGDIRPVTSSPLYQWVEWSVGEASQGAGSGLIDSSLEPIWFPLPLRSGRPIFDVSPHYPLIQGNTYSFRARVWYNNTHYSIFSSEGALVDSINPVISNGYRVGEYSQYSNIEIDYTQVTNSLFVKWTNVFSRRYSGSHTSFYIGVGDSPSSDNVRRLALVGNVTSYNITDLRLRDNREYYVLVQGVTPLGVYALSVSDGISIDTSPPLPGSVFIVNTGAPYHSVSAISNRTAVSLRLLGFHDPQSFIRGFEVGIAKPDELITNYVSIGLNLSPTLTGFDLEDGSSYRAAVKAISGAGAMSVTYSSHFIVDSTPPGSFNTSYTPLVTESFETLGEEPNITDSLHRLGWELDHGSATVISSTDLHSAALPDGTAAIKLNGCLSRDTTTDPALHYYLSFYILVAQGETVTFSVPCSYNEGILCSKVLSTQPLDSNSSRTNDIIRYWDRVQYSYYQPMGSVFSIRICSQVSPLIIDNIRFQYQSLSIISDQLVIKAHDLAHSSSFQSILLHAFDHQSDIQKVTYAIGTLPTGVQLQEHTLVSPLNPVMYPNLSLPSTEANMTVYITVIVTNFAGLTTRLVSPPITLDRSPPVSLTRPGVKEVLVSGGVDIDYTLLSSVWVDWSDVIDKESGIKHCQWGLGSSSGLSDIRSFNVSHSTSAISTIPSLAHGTRLYSIVSCINNAGQSSTFVSDGITLLQDPPSHQLASLIISSPDSYQYQSMSGHIPTDSMQLIWSGFGSDFPLKYQVRMIRSDSASGVGDDEGWCDVGPVQQLSLTDMNISANVEYDVQIRAFVVNGLWSQPLSGSFIIVPTPPVWNKGIPLNATWNGNRLTLEWSNVFSSLSSLTYEVSLGFQVGDTSFQRWASPVQEVEGERIVIINRRLRSNGQYVLALNALSSNGLYTTANYMLDESIAVPIDV